MTLELIIHMVMAIVGWELGRFAWKWVMNPDYTFSCECCSFKAKSNNVDVITRIRRIHYETCDRW